MPEASLALAAAALVLGLGCPTIDCPQAPELAIAPPEVDVALDPAIATLFGELQGSIGLDHHVLLAAELPGPKTPLDPRGLQPADDPDERERARPPTTELASHHAAHTATPVAREPLDPGWEHAAHSSSASVHGEQVPWPEKAGQAAGVLAGLVAIALYHKLTKDRALDHPRRREILSLIDDQGPMSAADIARALGVCYRTARHHLDKLARFDLLCSHGNRGELLWHLPDQPTATLERLAPGQRRTLALLADEPGIHLSELARQLGAAKATVKYQLDQLEEKGLIGDERVGPLRRFFLTEDGSALIASRQ